MPPGGRVIALSTGTPGQTGFGNRALTIVDRATWTILRTVPLDGDGRAFLSRDPQGRLWVALHGPDDDPDAIARVFSADGDKLLDVPTCTAGHRAVFAAGLAWVACETNGFVGSYARIDDADLGPVGTTSFSFSGSDAFTVTAAGLVGGSFAIAGNIDGGAGVMFFDTTTGVARQRSLGVASNIRDIVPDGAHGLFLNVFSALASPPGSVPDVFDFPDPTADATGFALAPSPRAGVVVGDELYVYASAPGASHANLARRSSRTGAVTTWPSALPGAVDQMATDGASIFLSHAETTSDALDGLYELDPRNGTLTRRLALPDATDLIFIPPRAEAP
ncbi:MAG: hypothetical protein JWM82_2123 [Myxococcales bacterium]|nr:hypothetical protein [Myxococcales bacterium]